MGKVTLRKKDFNMQSDVSMTFIHRGKGTLTGNARIEEDVFFIKSDIDETVKYNAENFFKTVKKAFTIMEKSDVTTDMMVFEIWRDFTHMECFAVKKTVQGTYLWKNEKMHETVTKQDALNNIALFLNGVMTGEII